MPLSDASASVAGTSWAAMSTLSSEIFQPSACNPASDRPIRSSSLIFTATSAALADGLSHTTHSRTYEAIW